MAYQIVWIFGKVPKGGCYFNPKIYFTEFGNFKQGFLSMKLIKKKSSFRVQGMFFLTIVLVLTDINWYYLAYASLHKCDHIHHKHCQRHNGPEDWVLLTKVTCSGHITRWTHKSWSNFIRGISTKHQIQNLNQTSASRLNLKFQILSKPSFTISTKIQLHNLYKTSAEKKLAKLQLHILPGLRNLQKLLPTRSSSATVTTSTSFELESSHARVTSIKFSKQESVS